MFFRNLDVFPESGRFSAGTEFFRFLDVFPFFGYYHYIPPKPNGPTTMWQKLLTILQWIGIILLLAGIFWQIASFGENVDNTTKTSMLGQFIEEPLKTGGYGILFIITKDMVTPAKPITTFGINYEIPFLDGKDALFMIPIWLLAVALLAVWWKNSTLHGLQKLGIWILVMLGVTIIGWLLVKLLFYAIMYFAGHKIGLSSEQITEIRIGEYDRVAENIGVVQSLWLSSIFFFVYGITLIKNKNEKQ